jgi:hypothetical protein
MQGSNWPWLILHPELSNTAILHRIAPDLVEALRLHLGESPYTAQAVGQMLSNMKYLHKEYLDTFQDAAKTPNNYAPRPISREDAKRAMQELTSLKTLSGPWHEAVQGYANQDPISQPIESPRLTRARTLLQNLMLYLAAAALNPQIPRDAIDAATLLNTLQSALPLAQNTRLSPQQKQWLQTAIEGPKSVDELAAFLDTLKYYLLGVERLPPFQKLQTLLERPRQAARLIERASRYPIVRPIP